MKKALAVGWLVLLAVATGLAVPETALFVLFLGVIIAPTIWALLVLFPAPPEEPKDELDDLWRVQ